MRETLPESIGRSPRESETISTEIVLPQHTNAIGTAFGGTIMSWIDICAAVSSQRHCGRVAVTASVDALVFRAPIRKGDVVVLRGRINAVFRSSMEVQVTVHREDIAARKEILCADALLTFVNLDDDGKPLPVEPLRLETEEDRRRDAEARSRRAERLAKRRC